MQRGHCYTFKWTRFDKNQPLGSLLPVSFKALPILSFWSWALELSFSRSWACYSGDYLAPAVTWSADLAQRLYHMVISVVKILVWCGHWSELIFPICNCWQSWFWPKYLRSTIPDWDFRSNLAQRTMACLAAFNGWLSNVQLCIRVWNRTVEMAPLFGQPCCIYGMAWDTLWGLGNKYDLLQPLTHCCYCS